MLMLSLQWNIPGGTSSNLSGGILMISIHEDKINRYYIPRDPDHTFDLIHAVLRCGDFIPPDQLYTRLFSLFLMNKIPAGAFKGF